MTDLDRFLAARTHPEPPAVTPMTAIYNALQLWVPAGISMPTRPQLRDAMMLRGWAIGAHHANRLCVGGIIIGEGCGETRPRQNTPWMRSADGRLIKRNARRLVRDKHGYHLTVDGCRHNGIDAPEAIRLLCDSGMTLNDATEALNAVKMTAKPAALEDGPDRPDRPMTL